MDSNSYEGFRQDTFMSIEISKARANEKEDSSSKLSLAKVSTAKTRGPYKSHAPEQIQELLDLVIEEMFSARKGGMTVGLVYFWLSPTVPLQINSVVQVVLVRLNFHGIRLWNLFRRVETMDSLT